MTQERLMQLWAAFVADAITAAESRELAAYLRDRPDMARRLFPDLILDGTLRQMAIPEESFLNGFRERLRALTDGGQMIRQVRPKLDTPVGAGSRIKQAGRRRMFLRVCLAAAATIVAGAALSLMVFRDASPPFHLAKSIGTVRHEAAAFETGPGSYARVDFRDGGWLGVNENSRVRIAMDGRRADLTHERGQLFLDVPTQREPWRVRLGTVQVDVLGTRLLLDNRALQPFVSVLEGASRVRQGESSTIILTGQTAVMQIGSVGSLGSLPRSSLIEVRTMDVRPEALAWLDGLDIASRVIADDTQRLVRRRVSADLDFDNYRVSGGDWSLEGGGPSLRIRQKDAKASQAMILFGAPRWTKGEVRVSFRLLSPLQPGAGVRTTLFYANLHSDSFGARGQLPALAQSGRWIEMRLAFEAQGDDTMIVHGLDFHPEGQPKAWGFPQGGRIVRTPEKSLVKKRGMAGLGLSVVGCAVEFKDLRIVNGVLAEQHEKGAMIFEDDFENGLAKWRFPDSGGAWAEGMGVDGGHGLLLRQDRATGQGVKALPALPDYLADFEMSFDVLIEGPQKGLANFGVAMRFPDDIDASGMASPAVEIVFPRNTWFHCRTRIEGQDYLASFMRADGATIGDITMRLPAARVSPYIAFQTDNPRLRLRLDNVRIESLAP